MWDARPDFLVRAAARNPAPFCSLFFSVPAAAAALGGDDPGLPAGRGADPGQPSGAAGAVIALPPAVVRDIDAVDAVLDGGRRILGGGDAFEDQRDLVMVLEMLDVVPVMRG